MRDRPPASSRARRAAYDVGVYGSAQVASTALALVLLGLLGRTLGSAGFGEFSFAFVVAFLGGLIADAGMGPWITRASAQDPAAAGDSLRHALRWRARTVALAWVLTLAFSWWYVRDAGRFLEIVVLLVYVTAVGYVVLHESLLMGRGRAGWVSLSVGGGKLLELAAVGGYVLLAPSVTVVGVGVALAVACGLRLAVVAAAAHAVLRREREAGIGQEASSIAVSPLPSWKQVLPFAAGSLLWTTYFKVDVLILERLVPRSDLGLYTAAYRVLEALLLVPRSVVGVLFPVVAGAWSRGELYPEFLARPARGLLLFAAGAGAGLIVVAPEALRFIFGPGFDAGAPALVVLGIALIPVFLNQYLGAVLTAIHRQGRWLLATLGVLVVNVAANFLLIPRLGFIGAAWATLISETVMLVALACLLAPSFGNLFRVGWTLRALAAAGAMAGLVAALPLGLPIRIAVGMLSFGVLAVALRLIGPRDWELLASLRKRGAAPEAT